MHHSIKNKFVLFLFLALAAFLGPGRMEATIYQEIRVNVLSDTRAQVQGEPVEMRHLTEVLKRHVHGDDRIRVALYVPLPVSKVLLKRVMDLCRAAGATSFMIAHKS